MSRALDLEVLRAGKHELHRPARGAGEPRRDRVDVRSVLAPEGAADALPDRKTFLALVPENAAPGTITVVQDWPAALPAER